MVETKYPAISVIAIAVVYYEAGYGEIIDRPLVTVCHAVSAIAAENSGILGDILLVKRKSLF